MKQKLQEHFQKIVCFPEKENLVLGPKWAQNGVNLPKFIKNEFFINFLNI